VIGRFLDVESIGDPDDVIGRAFVAKAGLFNALY
jgi:hypothetical protein